MATSAAGSNTFFCLALVGIALTTLLVLRYYLPLRTTPAYILVPVFLALALPASVILLVPIDLASTAVPEDGSARGIALPESALLVAWRISYWLTFVLTWFVLPLLGDYADSGHQDPKARIMYSLRVNARFQLILFGTAIAGLVYFFLTQGFSVTSLRALVMVLPYAFGLVIAIYLMGHGLVAIPRRLYRNAFASKRLRTLQTRAPKVHDRLTQAVEELDALESQVLQLRQRKNGTARDFQEWIEELADTSDIPESRVSSVAIPHTTATAIPAVITEKYLAELTRKLKRARHKRIRFVGEWDRLVREAAAEQAILDAAPSKQLELDSSQESWLGKAPFMTARTRFLYHTKVLPAIRLSMAGILALASISIIWSEVFKAVSTKLSIVGLSIVHHPNSDDGKIGFGGQVMATFWLLYMCTAALASVSEVKVWGNRALVRRHTYTESACWYSCQVAKLTIPLSYNFMTFTSNKLLENTAFYHFLGQYLDMTALGSGFSAFFPIFILLPVCATAFNLYGKVKGYAGFGVLDDQSDDDDSGAGWREGKLLIDRELRGVTAGGLASRDPSPLPQRGPAVIPTSLFQDNPTTSQESATAQRREQSPLQSSHNEEAQDEGGFFQDFAHRVRNTLDTTERPEWMPNVNVQRPKWMGGGETSGRAESGRGLGRWFGGRPADGRLRL